MILSESPEVGFSSFINLYQMIVKIISNPVDALEEIKNNNMEVQSIFSKANDAIMYFPLVTTNTISLKDLVMISKALERQYTTFLRLAMGLDNVIDNKNVTSVAQYVKKFHTNLKISNSNTLTVEDMKIYDNIYNKKSLQDILNEDRATDIKNNTNNIFNNLISAEKARDTERVKQPQGKFSNTQDKNKSNDTYNNSNSDYTTTKLQNNDVKKSNELIPTTFSISVKVKGERYNLEALLGVKVISHLVDTGSMVDNIESIILGNRISFRFMQWYTGEIKFFRDFLFMIDEMKKNAISNSTKKNSWWRALKDRAMSARLKSINFLAKDKLLPNSTLLLTIDEIEEIKNRTNINLLENTKIVNQIINHLFLLGMVVIDNSIEAIYFYFNGRNEWEKYAFRQLEKDDSDTRLYNAILLSMVKGAGR